MKSAIQLMESAKDESEARQMLDFCAMQVNYLAGRLLQPGPGKPQWRIQAFFNDESTPSAEDLQMVGLRRVVIPDSLWRSLRPALRLTPSQLFELQNQRILRELENPP